MKIPLKADTLDLSVVIAAKNEAPNLYRLIPDLSNALNQLGITWEVIIVDADSQDGTQKVVEQAGARYVCEKRPGYGTAIIRGVTEAHGAFVATMDADLSHPAPFIASLWNARHTGDIIIASRYVPGGHADQPIFRYALSRILNWFFGKGLSINVGDMSSGFRLYRKNIFQTMELPDEQGNAGNSIRTLNYTNFVILIQILLLAYANGLQIREVPFHYQPRISGSSKARIIKFGKDYLRLFYRVWKLRNSIEFPDYDWRAYDSRIWLQRYWQRTRHAIIMRFTPPFVSTCDVGCGSSRILADLPHAIAVDLRHDKLVFMRKTNRFLAQADGMCLPFVDNAFECVICSQVIEHIPDENGRLIDELTRILKPGGCLILGTPDYDRWQWRTLEYFYGKLVPGAYADEHVTHYTYDTLTKALTDRAYVLVEHDYVGKGELIVKAQKAGAQE